MLTIDQIIALAPDASAAKAGQGLANRAKWVSLGCTEHAVWGECAGSASTPYRTQVDLNGLSSKCSCPSRKFPCKHSLGLLLLLAGQPTLVPPTAPPAWVAEWLAGRARREEKRATRETSPEKTIDPAAQAKRTASRQKKVERGLEELDRWLGDLVRQGLGAVQGQPRSFWETPAARMVDAQASGVARMIREMATIPASGEGWQERLLERLAKLALLLERFKRLESLPEAAQADVRSLIGWTQSQEELLAGAGVTDRWLVIGQRAQREERLRVQRTWLWGAVTGQPALQLDYAAGKETFKTLLAPGMALEAEIVYYPGAYPQRALIKPMQPLPAAELTLTGYPTIAAAVKAYAGAVMKFPWLEHFPVLLDGVTPLWQGDRLLVRDADGRTLPVAPTFAYPWELLAVSGGQAINIFGEWNGETLLPLSAQATGILTSFVINEE